MPDRIIYEDTVGSSTRPEGKRLSMIEEIPESLCMALNEIHGTDIAITPSQAECLEKGILGKYGHFLIATPTNSGKTLPAILRMFSTAIQGGQRSVYIVPLKALAEEKLCDFEELAAGIKAHGGPEIQISITTGDYQLTDDFLGSPPPEAGEIVICTPERLEVMLRNPDNHHWARAIGTFVIDEFHLLGEPKRGATLETLVTRILVSCPWSAIIALSATVGGLKHLEKWMTHTGRHVSVISSGFRYPQLHRKLVLAEDKDAWIRQLAVQVASDPEKLMLIFVYTKNNASALARSLAETIPDSRLVSYFHAGLPLAERKRRMALFRNGDIRILATTTSLKMGINCPVTHVVVRDHLFRENSGSSHLSTADILQMLGRAGRRDISGEGFVLCDSDATAELYKADLSCGQIPEITPRLLKGTKLGRKHHNEQTVLIDPMNGMVLSQIALEERTTPDAVSEFIAHTYSASWHGLSKPDVRAQFAFLEREKLIYKEEGSQTTYCPTKLGRTTARTGLSPESGAVLAKFLRALIKLSEKTAEETGEKKQFLFRLTDLDLLFLTVASMEARDSLLPKPQATSKKAIEEVQEYLELLNPEDKPLVNLWRSEDSEKYPTRRLLGTLRIDYDTTKPGTVVKTFYLYMRTAILLHRHANGRPLKALADEYGVAEGTLESGLKFTAIWILSCLSQICNPNSCYNLKSLMMRIIELLGNLSLGASLGPLLQVDGIGRRTVERLIASGYDTIDSLRGTSEEVLVNAGIDHVKATKVLSFVRRRQR